MGEVGSGKTRLTARLLEEAVGLGFREEITAIDLAPAPIKLPTGQVAGGTLQDHLPPSLRIRYWRVPGIRAPRLEGKTGRQVLELAKFNARQIKPWLVRFQVSPTPILFINDASIYLQAGELDDLLDLFKRAETVVFNTYRGRLLKEDHGAGISVRERALVDRLIEAADHTIEL